MKIPVDFKNAFIAELQQSFLQRKDEIDGLLAERQAVVNDGEIWGIPVRYKLPSSAEEMFSTLTASLGGGADCETKMFTSDNSKWVCVSSGDTMRVGDRKTALETAKRYGAHFGMPVVVMSVCDSDAAYIGYSDHENGVAKSYKHGVDESGSKNSSPPRELSAHMNDEGLSLLAEIWKAEYIFEDDLLNRVAELIGIDTALIADNDSICAPEGYYVIPQERE